MSMPSSNRRIIFSDRFTPEKIAYFIIFFNVLTISVTLIYQLGFIIDFYGIITSVVFLSAVGIDLLFVLFIESYRKKDKDAFLLVNILSYLFLFSLLIVFLFMLSSTFHYIIWVFSIILAYSFYQSPQKQLGEKNHNGQD